MCKYLSILIKVNPTPQACAVKAAPTEKEGCLTDSRKSRVSQQKPSTQ